MTALVRQIRDLSRHVTEEIFESAGEDAFSLADQIRIALHLFFCSRCSEEVKRLETLHRIMNTAFFPPAPEFEKSIMEKIRAIGVEELQEGETEPDLVDGAEGGPEFHFPGSGGFSIRGWIIAGCFMFLSLATVFFGMDFIEIARIHGSSFLLPVGLTIGIILTGYGALFIGSHLKELSTRFRLH